MKLSHHLEKTHQSATQFGERIGAKSPATVSRYLSGRIPDPEWQRTIYIEPDGEVTPNDWILDEETLAAVNAKKKKG